MSKKFCGCGAPLYEIADSGFFECHHCDNECHTRCETDHCSDSARGKNCHQCKSLDKAITRRAQETRPR